MINARQEERAGRRHLLLRRTLTFRPVAAVIILLAALLPLGLNGYFVYLADLALIYITVVIGLTIILGWAGQLAFISSAFFGFGAFSAGLLATRWNMPAEVSIVGGTVMGLLLGVGFGTLVMRLKRYYLAIGTLSLMYMLDYFYRNFPAITGGVSGFPVRAPEFLVLGGYRVTSDYEKYYVALAFAVAAYFFARYLMKTPLGRSWRVVRKDERVAEALGIHVYRSKLMAFAISAGIMAFGGTWFVVVAGRFLPESFLLNELLFHFLILVVGGLGSLTGAVFSTFFLVFAREYLRSFTGVSELLFGTVLLLTVLFLPAGIYGTLARKFQQLRERVI